MMYVSNQRDLTLIVDRTKHAKQLNEHVRTLINDLTSGRVKPENIKEQDPELLQFLKINAADYLPESNKNDGEDLFIDVEAIELFEEQTTKKQVTISATEYLQNDVLTEVEIASLLETLKDLEDEV